MVYSFIKKSLGSFLLLSTVESALPDDVEYCHHPDPNMPGSGWLPLDGRNEMATWIIYAKAVEKTDVKTSKFGQSYTVEWETECVMKNEPRGFPSRFKMEHMGTFDPSDIVHCGSRKVKGGFNYIFYAKPDESKLNEEILYLTLDEVNNQTALFEIGTTTEGGESVSRGFAEEIYQCLSGDHCHDDSESETETWEVMSLEERIAASEYAMEVHMTDSERGCVQCILNEPANPSGIQHNFAINETLYVTEHEQLCHDSDVHIDGGKRYIMLLSESEINGRPNLKPNTLAPNEVNGQRAVYEVDSAIIAELSSLLAKCPAEDYTCPADEPLPPMPEPTDEPQPEPTDEPQPAGSSLMVTSLLLVVIGLVF